MDFYSNISVELGIHFMSNLNYCLLQMETMPYFQKRYQQIRIRKIRKFPVLLHFVLYETTKTVIIFGIRFAKEDPEKRTKL